MPLESQETLIKGTMRDLMEYGNGQQLASVINIEEEVVAARAVGEYLSGEIDELRKQIADKGLEKFVPNMHTLYIDTYSAFSNEEHNDLMEHINVGADDLPEEDAWCDEMREDAFAVIQEMRINARVLKVLMNHAVVRRMPHAQLACVRKRTLRMKKYSEEVPPDDEMDAMA